MLAWDTDQRAGRREVNLHRPGVRRTTFALPEYDPYSDPGRYIASMFFGSSASGSMTTLVSSSPLPVTGTQDEGGVIHLSRRLAGWLG